MAALMLHCGLQFLRILFLTSFCNEKNDNKCDLNYLYFN
uniref:Uncharacterized protein n=1 Tax=Anguilla anguilla TaxID=7936 RepID=A0A0E9PP84_ANGAN